MHSLSERATWAAVAGPCKTTPGRSLVRCASLCGLFAFNLTTNHNLSFQTCWFVGQRDNVSQRQGLLIMQSARVPDNGEKNKGLKQRKDASASVCKKGKERRRCERVAQHANWTAEMMSYPPETLRRIPEEGIYSDTPWRPRKYPLTEERVCFRLLER